MSSHITFLTRQTFAEIFKNIAKDFNTEPKNIQICICYPNGQKRYDLYKEFQKVKEGVDISEYTGMAIDFSGATAVIDSVVGESGVRYAKELDVPIMGLKIIMGYREKELPEAVLLNENKKVRSIDIQKEFLSN